MQWYRSSGTEGRCGAPQGEGKWREQMIAQWGGGKGQTLHIRLQSKQNVLVYKRYQRVSGINLWCVSGFATFWTILYCLDLFVSMLSVMQKVCHVDYKWG